MTVPFLDLKNQYLEIKEEVMEAIHGVLDSGQYIQGPAVTKFEENFKKVHGCAHAIGCSNGTNAITAALRVLGIGPGDEVITVANTFIATVEAIIEVGARPVLVDCDPDSYAMSLDQVEAKINSKTKAVIAVHLYGNPVDMVRLMKIADQHGLKVIEDCAQAHLATFSGQAVGTFGDFGTFSFYPGKNLGAYGDAGLIITQDEALADRVRRYINHGRSEKYLHEFVGTNYRMDSIQAAILNVKLKYLSKWTEQRQALAKHYDSLCSQAGIKKISVTSGGEAVYHLYVVEVADRDNIEKKMKQSGVQVGIHYPVPMHLQPALKDYFPGESFPVSEKAAHRILSLPIDPQMSLEQVEFVVSQLS